MSSVIKSATVTVDERNLFLVGAMRRDVIQLVSDLRRLFPAPSQNLLNTTSDRRTLQQPTFCQTVAFCLFTSIHLTLIRHIRCFDSVGWASGRASGLWKLSDEVLVWLSVCSEVQTVCIWSSWCHCHPRTPSSLASFKSRLVLLFWCQLTQVVLEKRLLNGCSGGGSNSSSVITEHRGHCHRPSGISATGGWRQKMWYADGQLSQHSSSPPSLHTWQNSMWASSSFSCGPFSS